MKVHGSEDEVSRTLIEEGIWEPYETDLVTRLLKPGQVFIDVGANAGYYSLIASHLVGESGQVVAFEPEQTNFALLSENLKRLELTNYIAIQAPCTDRMVKGYCTCQTAISAIIVSARVRPVTDRQFA